MSTPFELKTISAAAVPEALEKAERYRLLNDPEPAESICEDVLAIEPNNQRALTTIVLAIADQLGANVRGASPQRAMTFVEQLSGEYERHYYTGIVHERQGRAYLGRKMARGFAYDAFIHAIDAYEAAEAVRPPDNDDALLRFNSCVRTIRREKLEPMAHEPVLTLE